MIPQESVVPDGAIDESATRRRYEFSPDLVTLSDQRPEQVEAVRTMRTHIIARHIKDGRRGLAVCGATSGVGSTFTATNLAVALAQVGVGTLLIDGNMRVPRLEQLIRPSGSVTGLQQCVSESQVQPSSYIHYDVLPHLSLLYAGGVAENAQEILASDGFKSLIERCLRDFEFTIIDTPPASLCADGRRISTMVGYALIVARANASRMADVSKLADQLQDDGARVVGTVLNEV